MEMQDFDFTRESQKNMDEKIAVDVEEDFDVRLHSQDESEEESSAISAVRSNFVKKRKSCSQLFKRSGKIDYSYKADMAKMTCKHPMPLSPMECPSDNTFLSSRKSCNRFPFQYSSDACGSQQHDTLAISANIEEKHASSHAPFCHTPKETFNLTSDVKYSESYMLGLGNYQPDANITLEKRSIEKYFWRNLDCQDNDNSPFSLNVHADGKIDVHGSGEADILALPKREKVEQKLKGCPSNTSKLLYDYQCHTKEDSSNESEIYRNNKYQAKEITSDICDLKKNTCTPVLTVVKSPSEVSFMSKKRKDDYMSKLSKKTRPSSDESHEEWPLLNRSDLKSLPNGKYCCEFDQPEAMHSPQSSLNFTYPKQTSEGNSKATNYSFRTAQNLPSKFSYLHKRTELFSSTSGRNLQGNWREVGKPNAKCSSTLDAVYPLSNYFSPLDNEPHHDKKSTSKESAHTRLWRQANGSRSERKPAAFTPIKKFTFLEYDEKELQTTRYKPGFIDTHCHLDFLFQRTSYTGSYANFQSLSQSTDPFPVSYEGCVAIFCKPWTFKKINWWEDILSTSNVWAAFGCHPHFCESFGDEEEGYLRHALQNEKTVALGEIGLDYSSKNNEIRELQQYVFRKQLEIAMEFKKPVVIHCRDAHKDCIKILKEVVPRDYLIHRHCFTETWIEAEEWLESFSRVYFGFTNLVTYVSSRRSWNIREVVRRLPLNRLLLETDAPYFRPLCYSNSGQLSHPGMAIHVAAQVAKLRKEDIQVVLTQARTNTRDMYGI
ncbi:uncharacterized protein [Procambarus clarkii]|uniref:uncharacterized protein n=1 Tax=Procambarus clarkii TaxID=6728 RepID=UPI001E672613|nr:uncharacterized protein LOC123746847 [Procambarus clarkii]XP_045584602.1 uncharacterized protein LOC123746847 [Procambarus clarkii]XP_045584603.1 uncharacterized protein LOC123746847 [Procambarus clarkii]XP_045584604.1 uncharacterized protein LOC123746847 [Procambarus clarkii]